MNFNLTEWALNHRAMVLFLILVIGVGGTFSFTKLGQLEDPNFSVPSMTAMIYWPGATAEQIQNEVLNRMEKKFEQLDHYEKVVTFARQGFGGMTLSVWGGTSKADQREAWYQARKKFNDIKLELPADVVGPIFNDEYGDVTGLLYAVKATAPATLSFRRGRRHQASVKVPMSSVDIVGKQAKGLRRVLTRDWPRSRRWQLLKACVTNEVLPAGSIDTRGDRVGARSGQFASEEDCNVLVVAGGRRSLGDFTTITRGYEDPPKYTVRYNGQQVLMLCTDDQRRQHRRADARSRARSPSCRRNCPTASS
jgi:multidrug efflux pump subunit AcrB